MSAVFPNQGIDRLTQVALKKVAQGDLSCGLYVNDYTPVDGSTYGSFTEPTDGAYDAASLNPASWTGTTVDGVATYNYETITFNFGMGMVTVYGYFVFDLAAEKVIYAERFAVPKVVPMGTSTVQLNLTFKSRDFAA